jgi:hypothetical protein
MEKRWLAFRDLAGASLSASLSSTLPVGRGWRGGYLRSVEELLELDQLVRLAADQVGAAFGMWLAEGFAYGVAAEREHTEVPFLLWLDGIAPPDAAADALARCEVGPSYANWRQHTAQAIASWSVSTPRTADPLEVDAVLQITDADVDAVEAFCRLFDLAVPVDREPSPEDEAATARAALALAAERRRKRRSVETSW